MKKCLLVIILSLVLITPVLSEESYATLTVNGNAGMTVEPDSAQIHIGVSISAPTVEQASSENAAAIASVIKAVKDFGIPDELISSASYNVYPVYDYSDVSGIPNVNRYQVEHMLKITLVDLTFLGQVIDSAMTAGANQSYGITFMSSQYSTIADEVLRHAISDAFRKASIAAPAAGKEIGGLLSIIENANWYGPVNLRLEKAEADSAGGTQLYGGLIDINVSVTAVFTLK